MSTLELVKNKQEKTYADLEFLLNCLKEVLEESGEGELANHIPWISKHSYQAHEEFTEKQLQLYSTCFQLLNIAEVNGAVQNRRHKEDEQSVTEIDGLWPKSLLQLKEHGLTPNQIVAQLSNVHVEPVLTAHPTEAKRTVMLEHLRNLYLLVVKRENKMYSKMEQVEIRKSIKIALHRIWRISDVYTEKLDVLSELENITHYLTKVFPEVIKVHDRRLIQAWQTVGFDPKLLTEPNDFPKITFGNWVGGDRDGHPLVTAEVTRFTLQSLRLKAFQVIRTELQDLQRNLSILATEEKLSRHFEERFKRLQHDFFEQKGNLNLAYKTEPFKQYLEFVLAKLPTTLYDGKTQLLKEDEFSYKYPSELIQDLKVLKQGLIDFGAAEIANYDVFDAIRLVQTFGFHLAKLDIRQNSRFHELALSQLMDAAHINGAKFLKMSPVDRLTVINKELSSGRPYTHSSMQLGNEAAAVVGAYKVVSKHVKYYGTEAIGSLIVSMTRNVADLLSVYLLEREAGLMVNTPNGLASVLPVVPLFETIDDLIDSPHILDEFLCHYVTQNSLKLQKEKSGATELIQQVMIGYSDSNKDGGIFASQWSLFAAQAKLVEIGKKYNVKICFFHGKGGSISRGAGPTHWFLRALPGNSINGHIRLTEQGETIERKYANKINAVYNIELLTAGTLTASLLSKNSSVQNHPLATELNYLASKSMQVYKELTQKEGFIKFYEKATPIDAIEHSKIGSRPSRRTGSRTLADLRAIPWVFSWSQCRFNITSWYGVGTSLESLKNEHPEQYTHLCDSVKADPLVRYVLTNIDSSLASSDESVFKKYAELASEVPHAQEFYKMVTEELQRTRTMINELLKIPFEQRRKNHYYSTLLRAEAMEPLHEHQVDLLRLWRENLKSGNKELAEKELYELLRCINAIAGAIGFTG